MNLSVRKIVISGILGAIAILLGVTRLGFIPVPTPAGHATIMHIPAILGGVLEGPVVGLITGAIFGLFSFLQPGAPFFADPLVSILPRLFIGVVSYLVYISTKGINTVLACILAGAFGSVTNTVLVLGMATLRGYLPAELSVSIGILHGIPELIVAAILTVILVKGIQRIRSGEERSL
ncbi:MAG: ECF transporter S component [Bacillota bacterium]|nr:ECF transporter S component [Bacillota bacterium]